MFTEVVRSGWLCNVVDCHLFTPPPKKMAKFVAKIRKSFIKFVKINRINGGLNEVLDYSLMVN